MPFQNLEAVEKYLLTEPTNELYRRLNAKTIEIERMVAKAEGLGDINDLNSTAGDRLSEYVEGLIEEYEEAIIDEDKWEPRNQRLANTEIARLLEERNDIAELILDLRDSNLQKDLRDADDD